MRTSMYALLFSGLTSIVSHDAFAVEIRGTRSCGVWVKDAEARGQPFLVNSNWLIGYLSGLATGRDKDFIKGTTNDSIFLWISNYCRVNPLKELDDGADSLAEELIRKKQLK